MCLPVELHGSLCLALPRAFILSQNKSYSVIFHRKYILGISWWVPGGLFLGAVSRSLGRCCLRGRLCPRHAAQRVFWVCWCAPLPCPCSAGQEERSPASGDKDVFMAELFCSLY